MTIPADPRIGTRLAGYRIQALLGRGGMGVVYLAEQLGPRRLVALKLLSTPVATSEAFHERFLRESELAAAIDHPNVLPVYDAGETDGLNGVDSGRDDLCPTRPTPPAPRRRRPRHPAW